MHLILSSPHLHPFNFTPALKEFREIFHRVKPKLPPTVIFQHSWLVMPEKSYREHSDVYNPYISYHRHSVLLTRLSTLPPTHRSWFFKGHFIYLFLAVVALGCRGWGLLSHSVGFSVPWPALLRSTGLRGFRSCSPQALGHWLGG